MPANNNICQGISKFPVSDWQKLCCIWENDQDFGDFEETLCQRKLLEMIIFSWNKQISQISKWK